MVVHYAYRRHRHRDRNHRFLAGWILAAIGYCLLAGVVLLCLGPPYSSNRSLRSKPTFGVVPTTTSSVRQFVPVSMHHPMILSSVGHQHDGNRPPLEPGRQPTNNNYTICIDQEPGSGQCRWKPCGLELSNQGLWIDRRHHHQYARTPATTAVNGCVVSHLYRFVYIHVLKSAGMTTKTFLKRALCGQTSMPCPAGDERLQVVHCNTALKDPKTMQYLRWSVVRHPLRRLYAGYAMAQAFARTKFTWHDFVTHPPQRRRWSSTDPVHYRPQHEFLADSAGCPHVDYLVRLEHLNDDVPKLLQAIGSPELDVYYREHGFGHQHDTDYGSKRNESMVEVYADASLKQLVLAEYESDFLMLGYERTVPE